MRPNDERKERLDRVNRSRIPAEIWYVIGATVLLSITFFVLKR